MDTISEGFRKGLPGEQLFADELAVMAEWEEELQENWLKWQHVWPRRTECEHGQNEGHGEQKLASISKHFGHDFVE